MSAELPKGGLYAQSAGIGTSKIHQVQNLLRARSSNSFYVAFDVGRRSTGTTLKTQKYIVRRTQTKSSLSAQLRPLTLISVQYC